MTVMVRTMSDATNKHLTDDGATRPTLRKPRWLTAFSLGQGRELSAKALLPASRSARCTRIGALEGLSQATTRANANP